VPRILKGCLLEKVKRTSEEDDQGESAKPASTEKRPLKQVAEV